MWTAITYVTGGFSLIAFIAATISWVRLRTIRRDEVAIGRAAASDIPQVLDRIAGRFHVDTTSLTRVQKHGLVMEQLRLQAERLRVLLRAGLTALALLAGLTAFSLWTASKADPMALPMDQIAEGTAVAELSLPPQRFNMVANLAATTTAHISQGGQMELIAYANGNECKRQRAYTNWSSGPIFTATLTCSIPVLANMPFAFKAVQENQNANAHSIKLSISYQRQ